MSKAGARLTLDQAKKLALRLAEAGNTGLLEQLGMIKPPGACVGGAVAGVLAPKGADTPESAKRPGKRRKEMNLTEAEFATFLENEVRLQKIVSFEYEGITLRWGKLDNIQYTADFAVIATASKDGLSEYPAIRLQFIETKGAHIWPKDIQKFKAARNQFPMYEFQMWQRKQREWERIL